VRSAIAETLGWFFAIIPPQPAEQEPQRKKTKPAKNAPRFELRSELQRITGVDLTRIDGIDVMVAQTLISEVGLDMSRWKTEAHFSSWLGLCPDNRISGDKVLARGTRRVVNRAPTALRMAAVTLIAVGPTSERSTIRFYERIWLGIQIQHRRIREDLARDLFGEVFYWWYEVCFADPSPARMGFVAKHQFCKATVR
jgi:hypothetical protein